MKSVFVSSRFSEPGVEAFLSDLLAALNLQDLRAVIYRGREGRIAAGRSIVETNLRDIERADVFVAVVSQSYFGAPYCLNEAGAALAQRSARGLPILVVRWHTADPDPSKWPEETVRAMVQDDRGLFRIYADAGASPSAEMVALLCQDVCKAAGVDYDRRPDPVDRMPLIKRTRDAARHFRPASAQFWEGDLSEVLAGIRAHYRAAQLDRAKHRYDAIPDNLRVVRELAEERLGVRAASYLRLGEAVLMMDASRRGRPAGQLDGVAGPDPAAEVEATALQALHGDVYTQRDACVLLGNHALELGSPSIALRHHLNASRIAQLIEDGCVAEDATYAVVHAAMMRIDEKAALQPRGISAYVMFDNLTKCRVRLLRPPGAAELEARLTEWRSRNVYSDPSHYARYGSLLIAGFALCGHEEVAGQLLNELESDPDEPGLVDLETWRVLTTLVLQGLQSGDEPQQPLAIGAQWLAGRAYERKERNRRECALLMAGAANVLRHSHHGDSLLLMSRALEMYPSSIRLRVERAVMSFASGAWRGVRLDCQAAAEANPNEVAAREPFDRTDRIEEMFYMQGIAFWMLGRIREAEDRFRISGYPPAEHYRHTVPALERAASI